MRVRFKYVQIYSDTFTRYICAKLEKTLFKFLFYQCSAARSKPGMCMTEINISQYIPIHSFAKFVHILKNHYHRYQPLNPYHSIVDLLPPFPPHTAKQKDTKTNTLECKGNGQMLRISHHKNVNKRKNRLTPFKL